MKKTGGAARTPAQRAQLEQLRGRWLSPEFQAEVARDFPYSGIADAVIALRAEHELSQQQLAKLVGTTQSVIARLESGRHGVHVGLLNRIADALGLSWRPAFVPRAAAVDVLESGSDDSAEIIDLDERRRLQSGWQGRVVSRRSSPTADPQLKMSARELQEVLGRFIDKFAVSEKSDDHDRRELDARDEYSAV